MDSVVLYRHVSDDIKITIEAYFEGDRLVIDGYDIGKRVSEYWGDSDYEYIVKIPEKGIDFLFNHLEVEGRSREVLLEKLAATYNTNTCYSDIRKLMEDNDIECEGFTWA